MSLLETIGSRTAAQQDSVRKSAPDLSTVDGFTDPIHDPAESTDGRDRFYMGGIGASGPVLLRVDFKLNPQTGSRVDADAVIPGDYAPGTAFASDPDPETGKALLAVPQDAPAWDLQAGDPLPAFRVKRYPLDGFARALVLGCFPDADAVDVDADADPGETDPGDGASD